MTGALAKVGGLVAVGAGIKSAITAGINFDSQIEQTTVAMTTMLGSVDKAKKLIGEVTSHGGQDAVRVP